MTYFEEMNEELVNHLIKVGALKTEKIIEAFRKVPRHLFVPPEQVEFAYTDIALPTVKDSTISQPYTVALMTEFLEPKEGDKILEIGTGSGWQACLLSHIVGRKGKIVTIEIDKDVYKFGKENVGKLGVENVIVILGDGSKGYEKEAKYDGCMLTAGCPEIPKKILEQTKVGGRIVAPIGLHEQRMIVVKKISEKKFEEVDMGSFVFVPLRGEHGFKI
jgi:protein-L-isoaspartate(D-aspartate) O-methyltransferase